MTLNVYRNTEFVGSLDMHAGEHFYGFTYDETYLSSPTASALSLSLPLNEERYSGGETQPYFAGLLPEGDARDAIARRLGIARTSSVKLIKALGRDCAGDVSVLDEGEDLPPQAAEYLPYKHSLATIAQNPYEEITRLQEETRLSLAGGQEKIALFHQQGEDNEKGWYVPLLGSPSTHILKPSILEVRYPNLVLNEFLCLRAALYCNIPVAEVDILYPETPLLIVRRYDRLWPQEQQQGALQKVERLHQEDCCQACGIDSELKYEQDGGPGFRRIRDLLTLHSKKPLMDIQTFVKMGLFNYLIGNCDAHAKNYSLLHTNEGSVDLAPAYDLVSTAIYDGQYGAQLNRSMAMRLGQHAHIDKIDKDDFTKLAKDTRVGVPLLKRFSEELIESVDQAFQTACSAARDDGFLTADELANRILESAYKRIAVLRQL